MRPRRARSCTRSRRGRSRRAAAPSRPSSSRISPAPCLFFTALADDELGRRSREELEARGVTVHAGHDARERSAARSRTSTTTASGRSRCSATSSCPPARTARCRGRSSRAATPSTSSAATSRPCARRAARRVLVATSRELATLRRAAVEVDVLVGSGEDAAERFEPGELEPAPRDRRHDGRRARRLDPPRRAVPRGADPRPGLRRLRLRRLLRRRASRTGSRAGMPVDEAVALGAQLRRGGPARAAAPTSASSTAEDLPLGWTGGPMWGKVGQQW